jgi:hypothetical protein
MTQEERTLVDIAKEMEAYSQLHSLPTVLVFKEGDRYAFSSSYHAEDEARIVNPIASSMRDAIARTADSDKSFARMLGIRKPLLRRVWDAIRG